jgi:hypothetical protein
MQFPFLLGVRRSQLTSAIPTKIKYGKDSTAKLILLDCFPCNLCSTVQYILLFTVFICKR